MAISKIMIFGCPGSGKSTFALRLHNITGLPLYHLDSFFYKSNWIEQDYHIFLTIQQEIVERKLWIIDGNNTKSLELRYCHADLVFFFNYPLWICYWRIIKRLFKKDVGLMDRVNGCEETVRFSLIRYMWNFEKLITKKIYILRKKYPNTEFIEITSNKDLKLLENKLDLFNGNRIL